MVRSCHCQNMALTIQYQFNIKMLHINRFFYACPSLKNRTVAIAMLIFFA